MSHLAHVEAGRRNPSLEVLRRLAGALHIWPGLLLSAFLQTEMPEGHRPVFEAWVEELLDAVNGAQLELPIPDAEMVPDGGDRASDRTPNSGRRAEEA